LDGWHVCSTTCHSLQSGPVDELLLQIHGRAYPDASGACCGSDDVLMQEFTGYSVRVNHKVSTTAAASNHGDVELVNFDLVGSNNLVIDVLICCDHIGNSTVNNGHLNGKMRTNDYLQARAGA